MYIDGFQSFIWRVELKKLHLASLRGDDELCEVNKSAKKKLAEVTFCLRNHLHKSEQKYKELFLTTMLLFCNYDATNEIFDSCRHFIFL